MAGLHTFRHAAASEVIEQGAPLTVVQHQLHHRDALTALQKYGHVEGDAQRRAVKTLAEKIERHAAVELPTSTAWGGLLDKSKMSHFYVKRIRPR